MPAKRKLDDEQLRDLIFMRRMKGMAFLSTDIEYEKYGKKIRKEIDNVKTRKKLFQKYPNYTYDVKE